MVGRERAGSRGAMKGAGGGVEGEGVGRSGKEWVNARGSSVSLHRVHCPHGSTMNRFDHAPPVKALNFYGFKFLNSYPNLDKILRGFQKGSSLSTKVIRVGASLRPLSPC